MTATLSTSNITIDDEYAGSVTGQNPLYYSPGDWSQGSTCGSRCYVHLDPTQVYNGTWHDTTYYQMNTSGGTPSTVTLQFTGIAVYVYGVLANKVPNTYTQTFLDFTLDDATQQSFEHDPTSSTEFTYNALVFSKTGLDNTEHTLHIVLDPPPSTNSLFLLDYVVYTVVDQMKNSSSSSTSMTSTTSSPPVSTTISTSIYTLTTNSTSIHAPTTTYSTSVRTPSPLSVSIPPSTRSSSSTSPAQSPSFSPVAGPSQHKNPLPLRIAIGVVAGGTALAIGIVVALYLHRRRRSPLRSRVEPWTLHEKGRPVLSIGGASELRESTPLPGPRGDAGPSTSQLLPPITSATVVSNLHTEVTALREVMERLRGILGAETRSSVPPPLYEETARAI